MELGARQHFTASKDSREAAEHVAERASLLKSPWMKTLEPERDVCVLFPGQGTQKKGMADKLIENCSEAKALFERASQVLGYDLAELVSRGPQGKLDQTRYAQPAVFVTALAAVEKAKRDCFQQMRHTKMAAGFSLGEYCALVYGQAMTFEDGLRVVKARAEAMDEAAKAEDSCMASIAGVDDRTLLELIADASAEVGTNGRAYVANYMFAEGRTCSGDRQVLKKLCELVSSLGAGRSAKMVAVSGAFHTPYMESAQARLAEVLDKTQISQPTIPVLSNVTGQYFMNPSHIRALLKRQIVEPVRWEQCMREATKSSHGHAGYIESGPGKQLKAMMRRIDQEAWSKMIVLE